MVLNIEPRLQLIAWLYIRPKGDWIFINILDNSCGISVNIQVVAASSIGSYVRSNADVENMTE
jgi:hypothetical protein